MNPQGGALEAVAGAQGAGSRSLATLQALAEALGALGAANAAAAGNATPGAEAAQAEAAAMPEAVLPSSTALAAQAAQGQMTLGQLAAEQATRRAASNDAALASGLGSSAAAMPLQRSDVAPEGFNTPRLPDLLAVPVTVTAMHTPPLTPPRPQDAEAAPRRVLRDDGHDEGRGTGRDAVQDEDEAEPAPPDAEADHGERADGETTDPEAARLRAALERAGRSDAIAELDRGRRLLLVLPQAGTAPVQAVVWLLGPRRAQRHAARWWPGLASSEGWLPWRVFRDGDPQLGRGLTSRAAGPACRVRLGPQPPRLQDAGAASLEIAERIRFAQALGGQWSLLLLAAPAGWAP